MSTTIIPDIYRHTARKSTVSRNVKVPSNNVSVSNSMINLHSKSNDESSTFRAHQCEIKVEKDVRDEATAAFLILPDNEVEQMNIEQTHEEIISDIVEQIKNQIPDHVLDQRENLTRKRTISTDIHHVIDTLIDHVHNEQSFDSTNNMQMDDENVSMESNAQSSILSQSQIDEDILEIEVPPPCTCHCHQSISNCASNGEHVLFEQALRQTRQAEQQERALDNNHLIQILKRQHQELLSLYHRQIHTNKTDREQQTILVSQHDSEVQTDISTMQYQNYRVNIPQVNGAQSMPALKGPITTPRPFNSFLTPIRTTGPSLQQLIPCLATTTVMNKVSMIKKSTTTTTVATTNPHTSPIPPILPTSNSRDLVDLTEEDEEDRANTASEQKPNPLKPQQSSTSLPTGTARNQPAYRLIRPNNTPPLTQTCFFRSLPEHSPCDPTIARPQLSITHDTTTVRLTWNLPSTTMESIQNYEIYAYKHNAGLTSSDWRKIGTVNSMRLPMAVTLKEFQSNSHYAFTVRAVSRNNNIGPFCEPKTIFTGSSLSANQTIA